MAGSYRLMDPKVDFVFKNIFGDPKHDRILISFLNGVFGYTNEKKIVKVQIENPSIEKKDIEDKYAILDVKATVNDSTLINIEIQIRNPYNMIPRTMYYVSSLIQTQLKEGDNYNKILKSVGINILNFKLFKDNDKIHSTYRFKELETNEELSDLMEIHFLEIPKLKGNKSNINDLLTEWLLFLDNPESEVIKMVEDKVPEIKEALTVLEVMSMDKQNRIRYEARQKALKDRTSFIEGAKAEGLAEGLAEGRAEGKAEGKVEGERKKTIEIVQNMLKNNLSIEQISQFTNIEIGELKKLVEEIEKNNEESL